MATGISSIIPISDLPISPPSDLAYFVTTDPSKSTAGLAYYPSVINASQILEQSISSLIAQAQQEISNLLAGLGYLPPVNFGPGLNVDSTRFTVSYNGVVYAPVSSYVPFVTSSEFNPAQWRVIQGIAASDLAAYSGAAMVGFSQSGAGAITTNVQDALRKYPFATVEDYRQPSDPDDTLSFIRMHTALGFIRLLPKTYIVPVLSFTAGSIVILGARMPVANPTKTALVDGSGTIIAGTISLRANNFYITNIGGDVSDSRYPGELKEGMVYDAPEGSEGYNSYIENIASMGPVGDNSSHALLHEGFNSHYINNVKVYHHAYGVVSKSRNGVISNIEGYGIKVASGYAKSSLSEVAGGVLNGSVDNVTFIGVTNTAFTSSVEKPGLAVWFHAEGRPLTRCRAFNVTATGGRCAVRESADAGQYTSAVSRNFIYSDNQMVGFECFGTNFEPIAQYGHISNPSTGEIWETDDTTNNFNISNMFLSITDAEIGGTQIALMRGTGIWDAITVRSVNLMQVSHSLLSIRGGKLFGSVSYAGAGNLTLGAGVSATTDETPVVSIRPDNTVVVKGSINPNGAGSGQGTIIATLSGAVNAGINRRFVCSARTAAGSAQDDTQARILCTGVNIILESPAPDQLNRIDLSPIIIHRF